MHNFTIGEAFNSFYKTISYRYCINCYNCLWR